MNKSAPSQVERKTGNFTRRVLGGFQRFARTTVRTSGHPAAFVLATVAVVIWGVTGPWFNYGNTWLLVINTVTNIVTFLMIFLIRSAQNRESEAVQMKLDELIRANLTARNTLLDIEELSEGELDLIKARFARLARKAREEADAQQADSTATMTPFNPNQTIPTGRP